MSDRDRSRVQKDGVTTEIGDDIDFREGANVTITTSSDGDGVSRVTIASSGGGAPTDVDYLVGTADATLTNEIVAGTSPGGELGGTWASPTVDATHSGSAHHAQTHTTADHTDAVAIHDESVDQGDVNTLDFTGAGVSASVAGATATISISGSASPLTTKGDLFGYDTADARIPVGNDDDVLTADSAQALGVKWAAPGAATHPAFVSHVKWASHG